jgi:hypothetical protein
MRRARARATAVGLALALGMHGCGLVDSLTPLGVGTQDYGGAGVENLNGNWAGKTATGGDVTFQVGDDTVIDMILNHVTADCIKTFKQVVTSPPPIVDGVFTLELLYADQGRFVMTGTFTSSTTCSGTYFFEAFPAGVCPTSGSGTFTASKTL